MQISVSSTLTAYHDGQFWVGLAEHVEDGRYGAARIVPLEVTRCALDNRACYNADIRDENTVPVG